MGLTLSRRTGERIYIGTDIVVTVVEISGGKVRLDIEAPKEIKVFREEIAPREIVREPRWQRPVPVQKFGDGVFDKEK